MRLKLLLMLGILVLLCGCKASYPVAQSGGKEDVAYLLFVSPKEYVGKHVDVIIDGKTTFEAKVVKAKKSKWKGSAYAISTGRRKINVTYKGKSLYKKEIFVTTQETQTITLP